MRYLSTAQIADSYLTVGRSPSDLRAAKPADIPVEQPTKFDLIINLTAAGRLGLEIGPPSRSPRRGDQ